MAERNELIERTVQETLVKIGCQNLKGITYEWNRQKKNLGFALGYNQLSFSKVWWEHLTDKQRIEVVVHEVCHLGDNYLDIMDKSWNSTLDHGARWQELMQRAGASPDSIFYQEMPEKLKDIVFPYKVECGCGVARIPRKQYMKFSQEIAFCYYCCGVCNKPLKVLPIKK
jgi:predicted SprT family Zn-dependent metalloprotease